MTPAILTDREEAITAKTTPSLSHSRINRYLTCPEQYRLHYVERLRPRFTAASLAFGQVLHQALAALFGQGSDPISVFEEVWKSVAGLDLAYSTRESWEKLRDSGQALLEKFLREEAVRITNVVAVEKTFELLITGLDLPLTGIVDLVADLDGVSTVIDFKTTSSSYGEHEVLLSDQLTAYRLAEPEAKQAAFCVLIKTKKPKIEWHVTDRGSDQLTEYLEKTGYLGQEIRAGRFYKRPGLWCSWCDFLPVCVGDTTRVQETLIQVR